MAKNTQIGTAEPKKKGTRKIGPSRRAPKRARTGSNGDHFPRKVLNWAEPRD